MTRQEIIDYTMSKIDGAPGAVFIAQEPAVSQDALVILIGFTDRPGAVAVSMSGMELLQNSTDDSIRSLVDSRLACGLRLHARVAAEPVQGAA